MENLLYSKTHLWIKMNGNIATIGITDYAQEKLGNIIFVNLPDEGEKIELNEKLGDIESVKTVSDLISPVSGVVISYNEDVVDEPETINEFPYENWLVKIETSTTLQELMDKEVYEKYIENNEI